MFIHSHPGLTSFLMIDHRWPTWGYIVHAGHVPLLGSGAEVVQERNDHAVVVDPEVTERRECGDPVLGAEHAIAVSEEEGRVDDATFLPPLSWSHLLLHEAGPSLGQIHVGLFLAASPLLEIEPSIPIIDGHGWSRAQQLRASAYVAVKRGGELGSEVRLVLACDAILPASGEPLLVGRRLDDHVGHERQPERNKESRRFCPQHRLFEVGGDSEGFRCACLDQETDPRPFEEQCAQFCSHAYPFRGSSSLIAPLVTRDEKDTRKKCVQASHPMDLSIKEHAQPPSRGGTTYSYYTI
ncbi:MAG: hypothetical protein JWP06_985 [Candidatus Saccharibacteria bacterium]|nr:hypothetical protein [Candidatus Saccharibacteria bacterium]